MFTFIRVGYEPETYLEDYGIYYADTDEPFIINDYYDDDEGYDQGIIPVISLNRKVGLVELYEFCYEEAKPSDKPLIIKILLELIELKNEFDINGYRVIGDGADLYNKVFNKSFI